MNSYTINKGINKPIEFKGLKAQYIGYLAAVLVLTLIAFGVAYAIGISMYLCLGIGIVLGTSGFLFVFHLNAVYGEYGMMKKLAQKQVPPHLLIHSRKIFTRLNKH